MVAYHRQKLRRITVGRGYSQMGEIWLKKWNFEWLELWSKYLRDRPDIYREAYHRHKLPSIRGMKATTQDGGNLPQKWNFYWLKLWLKYARDQADLRFEFDTLPIPVLHTYQILIYLITLFVFFCWHPHPLILFQCVIFIWIRLHAWWRTVILKWDIRINKSLPYFAARNLATLGAIYSIALC